MTRVIRAPFASVLVTEGVFYVRLRQGVDLSGARPDLAISCARVPGAKHTGNYRTAANVFEQKVIEWLR